MDPAEPVADPDRLNPTAGSEHGAGTIGGTGVAPTATGPVSLAATSVTGSLAVPPLPDGWNPDHGTTARSYWTDGNDPSRRRCSGGTPPEGGAPTRLWGT